MDLIHFLKNDLITDNTKELDSKKLFLKTAQNKKYAKDIKNFITPKELINALKLKTKFIGITGTNGKTTTAFVLGYILRSLGYNVGIQGTEGFFYNNELKESKTLTTPPIFTTIKRAFLYNPDFFIMEVSSHAIVQKRIEGINFNAKILTSFSQDHLDFHKSMQEYKKAKELFFQDESIKVLKGKIKENCIVDVDGYEFKVNCKNLYVLDKPLIEDIKVAGEFNKMNFSLAIKTAELLTKENIEKIKNIAKSFEGVAGRMEIVNKNPLIIIDFAHTPDGMEKVLNAVDGKKIVVFGAGGNRDKEKRPLMGEVASKYAEFIFVTNDNPRCENPKEIANDIVKGISKPYKIILDRKEAIKEAIKMAREKNYTLFVLGKGDEKYIEFCNEKIEYNDKEFVRKLLIC
jgi:UDP-N-acetylmuramoyl-L-alanyl-D-glutamate--2,6-diaminopimelate ligase